MTTLYLLRLFASSHTEPCWPVTMVKDVQANTGLALTVVRAHGRVDVTWALPEPAAPPPGSVIWRSEPEYRCVSGPAPPEQTHHGEREDRRPPWPPHTAP